MNKRGYFGITELSIMGSCNNETVDSVYEQCYDLAIHSTFSVFSIISVLCAECRQKHISIAIGIIGLDEKLKIIHSQGL